MSTQLDDSKTAMFFLVQACLLCLRRKCRMRKTIFKTSKDLLLLVKALLVNYLIPCKKLYRLNNRCMSQQIFQHHHWHGMKQAQCKICTVTC